MSGPVEVALIVAAVCYVLARRLAGEPAQVRRMVVLPLVLAGTGLGDVGKVALTPVSIGFLVGTTLLSVLLGALRGVSVRVYPRDGLVHVRYRAVTVLLWVVNVAVKFGGSFLLGAVDPAAGHAAGTGLLFTLGAGMAAEGLVVMARGSRIDARFGTGDRVGAYPAGGEYDRARY